MANNNKCGYKAAEARITFEVASQYFSYDPETGHFLVKQQSARSKTPIGAVAGQQLPKGYIFIHIPLHGRVYAHRLAFLFMTGEWPKNIVDHLNHIPDDNRWENLRDVDYSGNNHNSKVRKDNTSGVRGVSYSKKRNKYIAQIRHQKITYRLGAFDTLGEAANAVLDKYEELGIYKDNDCIFASNQNL